MCFARQHSKICSADRQNDEFARVLSTHLRRICRSLRLTQVVQRSHAEILADIGQRAVVVEGTYGGWEWNAAAERAGTETLGCEIDLGPVLRQRPVDVRQHLAERCQPLSTQLLHRRIRANSAQVEAQAPADRIRNVQGKRTLRCIRIGRASLISTRHLYGAVDGVDAGTATVSTRRLLRLNGAATLRPARRGQLLRSGKRGCVALLGEAGAAKHDEGGSQDAERNKVNGEALVHSPAPRRIRLLVWKVTSTMATCTRNIFINSNFKCDFSLPFRVGRSSLCTCGCSLAGFVLAQQESAQDHSQRHPGQQAIDVGISQHRSLLIELTINLPTGHRVPSRTAAIRLGESVEPLRKDLVSSLHMIGEPILMT